MTMLLRSTTTKLRRTLVPDTWFKDQYGNLIGDVKVATVFSYGVITSHEVRRYHREGHR